MANSSVQTPTEFAVYAKWTGEASRIGGWHCKQLSWDLQKVQHLGDYTDIYKAQEGTDKYTTQVATFYQDSSAVINNRVMDR